MQYIQTLATWYGEYYTILRFVDVPVNASLRAEKFGDLYAVQRFLRDLHTPEGYWQRLAVSCVNYEGWRGTDHRFSVETSIADALLRGELCAYRVTANPTSEPIPGKQTRDGNGDIYYRLLPANAQLTDAIKEIKRFKDLADARAFLHDIKPTESQLQSLVKCMGFTTKSKSGALLADAVSQALVEMKIIVSVERIISSPPKAEVLETMEESPGNRKVDSWDVASAAGIVPKAAEKPAREAPICQRNGLTVSCSHGRSVTLDPNINYMPTLEVVACTPESKKSDKITLTSDISSACSSHKPTHITISGEQVKVFVLEEGKTSSFNAFGEYLNIQRNPVKYAWLPGIKPKIYTIYPGKTCDDNKMKGAGSGIQLNVYPQVAWSWGVNIGYGKDTHKIEEHKNNKGTYKRSLANKRFGIDGYIKLTQDNETFEVSSEFRRAIDSTVKQIEAITKLVDNVIKRFDEGKQPSVTVTWPNLNLNLKTELAEGRDNYRTVSFDFGISAAPFFGLEVKVDILPVLAKPLDGGVISKWLIEEAREDLKKGIGKEDSIAHLKGDVIVEMTGKGSLSCEAHFKGDFSNNNNNIDKVSGKPVIGVIEFNAEGKIDLKGHLLKVKIELVAGVGIKSGITLGIDIDKDDKGYYWQPQAKFNGLKVYIVKYVKMEENVGGKDKASAIGKKYKPNMKVKETKEHVWITEKNMDTIKRYFIEY